MGIIGEVKISPDFADLHPLGVSFREEPRVCFRHYLWSQSITERAMHCAMNEGLLPA